MSTACSSGDLFDQNGPGGVGPGDGTGLDKGTDDLPHVPVEPNAAPCFGGTPVIKVTQCQKVNLLLQVRDRNGTPINLNPSADEAGAGGAAGDSLESSGVPGSANSSSLVGADSSESSEVPGSLSSSSSVDGVSVGLSSSSSAAGMTPVDSSSLSAAADTGSTFMVRLVAKAKYNELRAYLKVFGTIREGTQGLVDFSLETTDLPKPGIYMVQLQVVESPEMDGCKCALLQASRYWLQVSPNLNVCTSGPLTIPEIRLLMRDQCAEQNRLLDAVEYYDEEIITYIHRTVCEFNEKWQPTTNFHVTDFPYRFHWALGVLGYMLRSAARHQERNRLAYDAGGVSINDKDKFPAYWKMGDKLIEEWRDFIASKKKEINFERGYATQLSGYSDAQNWWWY